MALASVVFLGLLIASNPVGATSEGPTKVCETDLRQHLLNQMKIAGDLKPKFFEFVKSLDTSFAETVAIGLGRSENQITFSVFYSGADDRAAQLIPSTFEGVPVEISNTGAVTCR